MKNKGDKFVCHNGPLLAMKIKDRKEVKLLSTKHSSKEVSTGMHIINYKYKNIINKLYSFLTYIITTRSHVCRESSGRNLSRFIIGTIHSYIIHI